VGIQRTQEDQVTTGELSSAMNQVTTQWTGESQVEEVFTWEDKMEHSQDIQPPGRSARNYVKILPLARATHISTVKDFVTRNRRNLTHSSHMIQM